MYPFSRLHFLHPILPFLVALSLLWTAWDFKYASFRKAQLQGRDVRMQGKRTYNVGCLFPSSSPLFDLAHYQILQISTWATRMLSSILLCIRWFRPHLATLQLDGPRATENRIYLLITFSLEIIVSDLMHNAAFY
jgi:hypothetical protein